MFNRQGSLGEDIGAGRRPAQLVFSGQDPQWDVSLQRVLSAYPGLHDWATEVMTAFGQRLSAAPGANPALASAGVDPVEWLEHPDEAFPREARASAAYCLVGTSLGHLLACRAVAEAGVIEESARFNNVIGHSVGLFSAWNVARHGLRVPVDAAAETLFTLAMLGEVSARHRVSLSQAEMAQVLDGDTSRCVMLSVGGLAEHALRDFLDEHRTDSLGVALQNSWDRFVLAGEPGDLAVIAGRLQETKPGVGIEAVPSSAPFHHRLLAESVAPAIVCLDAQGVRFTGDLQVPLVDPRDGAVLSGGDQSTRLIESMLAREVRWADAIASIVTPEDVVVDLGPSSLLTAFTRRVVRGMGTTVVAFGEDPALRVLTDADRIPRRTTRWSNFLPTLAAGTDGDDPAHRVVTRHTLRSHRSAFILAGMNPTTVDARIVVAAANAGHVAELGGGGQVSATIFTERMAELSESLTAGHEVTFNALNLDPYLWDLHIGRERMVQRARTAGAPICGVTVSAGIPDTEEAVALIAELHDLGIWLNAFKPGTPEQVQAVLEIADRVDEDLWIHMEGGRAGGHHSWVELEDLLFATYAEIRERDNVVLCVGGGVGTPERAAELLGGTWALRYNAYRMPVDAVLLGTAAMACAESTASPSVKEALVAAPGTDVLIRSGEWRGGVTSSRSSLGADIHCLDSHAARVADLLDEVAGDATAVAQRHDEIAEALNGTAKPWFGDLATMTYVQMLERFVELCARGRHGRYEDGCWFDHTIRMRFLELLRRTEARCHELDEGVVASLFSGPHDLDDPHKAIEALHSRYPLAGVIEMEPTDVAHFIEVCDGPGKPVPFVAVIDSEVRRRYLVDSLWQAHSDLWTADEVLVIPGPVALAGITRVDEPIAELLERFDREVARALGADPSFTAVEPQSVSTVEILLALPNVRSAQGWTRSPLRALGESCDWELSIQADHVVATLDHGSERAEMRGPLGNAGTVEVRLNWPALTDLPDDGVLEFSVHVGTDHGVPWAAIDESSIGAAQHRALDYVVEAAEPVAEATRSQSRLTPAPLVDAVAVPDAAIRMLWPGLFGALRDDGAGDGLLQLVHANHRVRGNSVVGAQAHVHAQIIGHDHVPAGRRIHTRSLVGDTVVEDTFLLRGWQEESSGSEEPVDLTSDEQRWVDTERHHLARTSRHSPRHPEQFAKMSGDLNPIHRSDLLARFTGLPGRIVHGMWTSAAAQSFLVSEVLDGAAHRLVDWKIDFLGMVLPGERIEMTATRVARVDGRRRVEVLVEGPRGVVARAFADVCAVRTAYVFPGQGIQSKGMGMDGYERSKAARSTWDRADAYTRWTLGFSLLDVVQNNPILLRVGDEIHRHPEGVLNLTQFTQVAMATLAAAQVAEMRAEGAFDETAVLAGHSIGEYNALAAIGGVLPFEATLSLVWARGTAMHHLVPRDDTGASQFRLGVIRPHLAGLGADEATTLVEQVAAHTGELCEVVNHNLRGRQYAVAGTVGALEVLADRLGPGDAAGRQPFLLVPGIDVPFHSSALAGGVREFQAHLDAALPDEVDPELLVGRYVPNLYPVPLRIDRDYIEGVARACGVDAIGTLLERWEELHPRPRRLTRELLVQLLAWQFASPVRWIEATEVMVAPESRGGLGVRRVVEVGLGAAPTLTNLTSAALLADDRADVAVLHVELHPVEVFDTAAEPEPVTAPVIVSDTATDPLVTGVPEHSDEPVTPDVTEPAQMAAPTPKSVSAVAQDVPVLPVSTADALEVLLAHSVQVNADQLGDDSVDLLVGGASSRRNQVMMDIGKEFGIGAVDGAHELDRHDLAQRLTEVARTYAFPGPVLGAAIASGLASLFGPLGAPAGMVAEHLDGTWGLGADWVDRCRIELFLGSREASSRRGGSMRTLEPLTDVAELIDVALAQAARRAGVVLQRPSAEAAGTTVDSVELDTLMRRVDDAFSAGARAAAEALSQGNRVPVAQSTGSSVVSNVQQGPYEETSPGGMQDIQRLALLDLEHGVDRAQAVEPVFDPRRVHWFASGTAWARADLDHLFHSSMLRSLDGPEVDRLVRRLRCFSGTDRRFDDTLAWYLDAAESRPDVTAVLAEVASGPEPDDLEWMSAMDSRVVLVSGASPGSIAESVVERLLAGGATVIVVTSSSDPRRRRAARSLERDHAGPGAQLYFVQANLASFTDVQRLCEWLDTAAGPDGTMTPGLPDVVLPFAAPRVMGDVPDTGPSTEVDLRVLLLGVERLVGGLSERAGASPGKRKLTAVLPLSPNHGIFGGDGAYGASKAGLEVLIARRRSEYRRWGRHCRIVAAEIGWVRGTSLMAANDELVPVVEQQLGIRTWSAHEMGEAIARLCGADEAPEDVQRVDLTGGLGDLDDPGSLADLLRGGLLSLSPPAGSRSRGNGVTETDGPPMLAALPTPGPASPEVPWPAWPESPQVAAEDMVVICGVAEVGPWGTSTTRAEVELDGVLSARGVLELALRCGLVQWRGAGVGMLVDVESGEVVPESEVAQRYRSAVMKRCGIRSDEHPYFEGDAQVFIDRTLTLGVGSEEEARAIVDASPGAAFNNEGGVWTVELPAGAAIRLPRHVQLPRSVTAPLPAGMDPQSLGLPVDLASTVDPLAAWNIAVSAEAFRDAGTDPDELLTVVHPASVADTQGCGMGGMDSLRGLFIDPIRGVTHANDLLQEALPNVPAAHAMQSLLGGYGSMVHPVGACATAAVSLEVALDLVRLGKADVVLAGGYDDLSHVGIIGFADMSATADDSELAARGYEASEMSRPGDRSRAGFVESAGGGSLVVCRGSVAVELGLPVRAVLAMATSHSDGLQRSIPAPGLGALSVARGGDRSPLAEALARHGLTPDDIAVVSKHDTSTRANDPNEAAIHERVAELLGRTTGNPMRVISQKSLTGHSKGGAAAWQVAGLCDVFDKAIVPGNRNLDSVDPDVVKGPWLVVDDLPLRMHEPPKAALLTSLGFGHVSAVVLLVHPAAFGKALSTEQKGDWLASARARRREANRERRWQLFGGPPAFVNRGSRLRGGDDRARADSERLMLADPHARLGADGLFSVSEYAESAETSRLMGSGDR